MQLHVTALLQATATCCRACRENKEASEEPPTLSKASPSRSQANTSTLQAASECVGREPMNVHRHFFFSLSTGAGAGPGGETYGGRSVGGSSGNGRKGRSESTRALAARVRWGRRHGIRPNCNVAEDKRRRGRSVARDKAQKRSTQARRGEAETGGVD